MLRTVLWVTAAAGIGGTGLGGLLACWFRRDAERTVSLLLSFAAGVMTAVVCSGLLREAMDAQPGLWGFLLTASSVLLGCVSVSGLNGLLNRCGQVHRQRLLLAGLVMAAAIALHNVPEGMVIGASFAQGTQTDRALLLAAVIALHNIPEGMAVTAPLVSGGMRRGSGVLAAALTGAPTVLGAALGYGLGTLSAVSLTAALGFASGAMLYVVFGELLPESLTLWQSRTPALAAICGVLIGMCAG